MKNATRAYGAAVGIAVGTALFLVLAMGAVGIIGAEGNPADLMYVGVLAVGIGGAIVARFQPDGMVRTMLVMAGATALVAVITLLLGKHQAEYSSAFDVVALNGMFATMFAGSAWLFRRASAQQSRDEARPQN